MSLRRSVVIVGAGGHGRELADVAGACAAAGQDIEPLGFIDADASKHGRSVCGLPVLGDLTWIESHPNVDVVVGIGSPLTKLRIVRRLEGMGANFATLVHPRAVLTRWIRLGQGVVITAGVVTTNQIVLGDHVHLNRCCTIGHDCHIGRLSHIAPGAVLSGNVRLGEGCDIGTCASVLQDLTVGPWARVGSGAAVVSDVPANSTVVGVPAKVVRTREPGWHLQ